MIALTIALSLAFAWSMGAHYTGACMGMPYASRSIRLWPALWTMAPLALAGAALASHGVERTVGDRLIDGAHASAATAPVIVACAFALTTLFTAIRVPTSTIQILVFCVTGSALAEGLAVSWATIARLAVLWVAAPFVACALGFVLTHALDRLGERGALRKRFLPRALVAVGAAASFVMGANDVANASGVLVMRHIADPLVAGAIGGVGLAAGVVTWGKPLLQRIAFDIVRVDLSMATAAQAVQAIVVFVAVSAGYFTSLNQALVGAMAGAGLARGRETIDRSVLVAIARGWIVAPVAGLACSYALMRLVLRLLAVN